MVEAVDLFENFVNRSDDAGLGPGEAVTVIFQPGGERRAVREINSDLRSDLLGGDLGPGQGRGDDHQEKPGGGRHAGSSG